MMRGLINPENAELVIYHPELHAIKKTWPLEGVLFRVETLESVGEGLFRYGLRLTNSSLNNLSNLERRFYDPLSRNMDFLSVATELAYRKHRVLPFNIIEPDIKEGFDRFVENTSLHMDSNALKSLSFNRRVFTLSKYLEMAINSKVAKEMGLKR
ncbi:hypothetical protein HOD53_03880 [Candidatus Woesearchaeota archaeon]|jgi:hypothetical protein|nr:hypothetical protein [Candidatus Woesearchaeota archaeon]